MSLTNKHYHKRSFVANLLYLALISMVFSIFGQVSDVSAESLDMTIDVDSLSLNLLPTIASGRFARSNNANISVATDGSAGYTLSVKAANSQNLIGSGTASGNSFTTIGTSITESVFSSNSSYDNKWGYLPSKFNSIDNTTSKYFYPAPTTTGDILDVTDTANVTANIYTLAIGARANASIAPGSYSNTFIIEAVSNTPPIIYMQDATIANCAEGGTTFYDKRDDADYSVARFKDGSCWMTQNLRLGADGRQVTVNSSNSNVTNQFQFTSSSSSNIFTSGRVNTASAYYSGNAGTGSFYNWYTVTAGTGTSSTGAGVEASGSICPKGWVLPSQDNYLTVLNAHGITDRTYTGQALISPEKFNYVSTGYYNESGIASATGAAAWKRNAESTEKAKIFYVGTTNYYVNNTFNISKYYGSPVRCRLGGDKSSFTVVFNANGGSGTMSDQSTTTGTVKLNANSFTRPGYEFVGWNTDQGTTKHALFDDEETIMSYESTLNLYAVWRKAYTTTFTFSGTGSFVVTDSNGNTVGTISSSGSTLSLYELDDYTIRSVHAIVNSVSLVSGVGTVNSIFEDEVYYTAREGNATININHTLIPAMQSYSKAACSSGASSARAYVYDSRDDKIYIVRYINGNCWMVRNLRFVGSSINSSTTNINTTKTISYGPDSTTGSGTTTVARIHDSGNRSDGVWYNYAAASAMTVTGSSNSTTASYSLCPAGWKLPSKSEFSTVTSYSSVFEPVANGFISSSGTTGNATHGYWYASTAYNEFNRDVLDWDGSSLKSDSYRLNREWGGYIRCIRSS